MTYRVLVTDRARADALETFRWMADQSSSAANRWYLELARAITELERMPEIHPVAEDESEQLGLTLREKLYGRKKGIYRLLFSIDRDAVIPLRPSFHPGTDRAMKWTHARERL